MIVFQINTGAGRDVITDYGTGNNRIKLLGVLTVNELSFRYAGGHTKINDDERDLLAIVQNTIAEDITFILGLKKAYHLGSVTCHPAVINC